VLNFQVQKTNNVLIKTDDNNNYGIFIDDTLIDISQKLKNRSSRMSLIQDYSPLSVHLLSVMGVVFFEIRDMETPF